jgi:hypothetical protein
MIVQLLEPMSLRIMHEYIWRKVDVSCASIIHACMRNFLFGHYHQPTARFDERALEMELDLAMASLAKR